MIIGRVAREVKGARGAVRPRHRARTAGGTGQPDAHLVLRSQRREFQTGWQTASKYALRVGMGNPMLKSHNACYEII